MYYNDRRDIPLPLQILLVKSKYNSLPTVKGRILIKHEHQEERIMGLPYGLSDTKISAFIQGKEFGGLDLDSSCGFGKIW